MTEWVQTNVCVFVCGLPVFMQRLQGSNHDTTLEEIIPKMFAVFSSPPSDWAPRRDRCRSCAVVGNSGNLLGSKYGDDIDANTMIIR